MPDITMCANKECRVKESCYRYIAEPSQFQSYSMFKSEGGNCDHYWLIEKNDKVA